ncbi:asparagine synthase (glutamine-hydrolyzing) [Nonomuraea sp. NPDC050691]|uniref:asparagine synthase (glutamine-hydrolyzing) n=1 Tax=Nonomuraea sp. NPDC050691 TaxID=3155661 RepID=UPI0033EBD44B
MCRIFGHIRGPVSPHILRRVAAVQRHGGPDGQYLHTAGDWSLGSDRLAVIDVDGGRQPYRSGGVSAVFNGEIYNHRELRDRLRARGHHFDDRCDGGVIPALYLEYGRDFTRHLDGMYAIAVVDERSGPQLSLHTDESGMKPLYYHWCPRTGRFFFSSELPALFAFGEIPVEREATGLDTYLTSKTPFGESTMFAGVRVMPPAATLLVGPHGAPELRTRSDTAVSSPGGSSRDLRRLLRQEVHRLCEADVPVAAITSGGLDSSLVTALAAERAEELHTFNVAYTGDWPDDESAYAAEVADRHATRHHQVRVDPGDFPYLLREAVWHTGQPNADPITLSTFALFRAVRDAGFKVALTGDAADELFTGYDRLVAGAEAPAAPGWAQRYVDTLAAVPPALREELYSPDYRQLLNQRGRERERLVDAVLAVGGGDRLTGFELRHRLPAYHLRRVDHLSMASSVEVRLPFCQRSVVEFARGLPLSSRVHAGRGKKILLDAAEGLLPRSVLDRRKQPFTLPITAMLHRGSPILCLAADVLTDPLVKRSGELDCDAVARLLDRQVERPDDESALAVWALLVYFLWMQEFDPAGAR